MLLRAGDNISIRVLGMVPVGVLKGGGASRRGL